MSSYWISVGRVTGDELTLGADAASGASSALVAKHGHWVVDNDIVVSGGQISADTTQTSSVTAQSDNPAYLELTGDLDLIDTSESPYLNLWQKGGKIVAANGSRKRL